MNVLWYYSFCYKNYMKERLNYTVFMVPLFETVIVRCRTFGRQHEWKSMIGFSICLSWFSISLITKSSTSFLKFLTFLHRFLRFFWHLLRFVCPLLRFHWSLLRFLQSLLDFFYASFYLFFICIVITNSLLHFHTSTSYSKKRILIHMLA